MWHSLRASCESDLAQCFPLAVVTKWMGNTPSVALRHYIDPTETAYDEARGWTPAESGAKNGAREAQFRAQQVPAEDGTDSQGLPENADGEALSASPCDSQRRAALLRSGGEGN